MTVLQFSLFFVALLIGYVLVHIRLARFEEHLQKLAGLRSVDERLKVLVTAVEKLGTLERIEASLDRLHGDLEDLREATGGVQEAVYNLPQPSRSAAAVEGEPVMAVAGESPAARLQALVESRLLQLGYGNIRILGDLTLVSDHGDADVTVECERGGMAAKGTVQVRNFGVRDVSLQTVAPMFP